MMLELTVNGVTKEIPARYISRLAVCPRRVLDNLPLAEIEEYIAMRRQEA